jgi:LemA protein
MVARVQTKKIVERLYPGQLRPRMRRRITRQTKLIIGGATAAITLWIAVHLYYYNYLVGLEFAVKAAWAQVETQQQRRAHIQRSLTRMVLDYAQHEQSVLTGLTTMRTNDPTAGLDIKKLMKMIPPPARPTVAPAPGPPTKVPGAKGVPAVKRPAALSAIDVDKLNVGQIARLFGKIQAVAEQYPALRLSENFQQYSKAIVETETMIAIQLMIYNESVNVYTTVLTQFPGNIFGAVGGFEAAEFYKPAADKLQYQPVKY